MIRETPLEQDAKCSCSKQIQVFCARCGMVDFPCLMRRIQHSKTKSVLLVCKDFCMSSSSFQEQVLLVPICVICWRPTPESDYHLFSMLDGRLSLCSKKCLEELRSKNDTCDIFFKKRTTAPCPHSLKTIMK